MELNYKNFSIKSCEIIKSALTIAEEDYDGLVNPQILFLALANKAKEMCLEIFEKTNLSLSAFTDRIKDMILCDKTEKRFPSFSDESLLILIRASYVSLLNNVSQTSPVYILQSVMNDCNLISSTFKELGGSVAVFNNAIESYAKEYPYPRSKDIAQRLRYDHIMRGWGYDVCALSSLSDYQKGFLINALEQYCESGFLRPFRMAEEDLIVKLDEKSYHIGYLVRRIKLKLNMAVRPLREGKLLGGEHQINMDSEQINESDDSSIKISDDVLKEVRERLKEKLLRKIDNG